MLERKPPLYSKPPKVGHLRVFGRLCYASTLPRGDNFAAKPKRPVFIGYSEVQKGYRLYDLEFNSFLVRRDVSFREDIFPFKALPSDPHKLFLPDPVDIGDIGNQTKLAADNDPQRVDQLPIVDHLQTHNNVTNVASNPAQQDMPLNEEVNESTMEQLASEGESSTEH